LFGRVVGGRYTEKSNKMQQCIKLFIIPYLYEAQHVSGDTSAIIRSLKLHWQPLVFHTWKVVWTCSWWTIYRKIQQDAAMFRNLLFHIYMKLNMFRATHRPSSGA